MHEFSAEGFGERLRLVVGNESVNSFARRSGISEGSLRQYLAGSVPGADKVVSIAVTGKVSIDWLLRGAGDMRGEEVAPVPAEFRLIPRLPVQPSSGFGSLIAEESPMEMLAFRSDWLRKVGINPDFAHVLTNRGDSNEPTIRDGDVLLVDTSIDRVIDNAFYIVIYQGNALLKRVQMLRDGTIVLSSDNKQVYRDEIVPASEVPDLRIAARLMWFGRSI